MKGSSIYEDVKKLIEFHGTRSAETILRERSVELLPALRDTKVLALYKIIDDVPFVLYNADMDSNLRAMVFAHELGHDFYHRAEAKSSDLIEYSLFDIKTQMEIEANIFAAHLLLDEEEVFEYIKRGFSYEELAKIFSVNINMMIFKLNEMQRRGYNFNLSEYPDSTFFKSL